jgi:hypothetical protein
VEVEVEVGIPPLLRHEAGSLGQEGQEGLPDLEDPPGLEAILPKDVVVRAVRAVLVAPPGLA